MGRPEIKDHLVIVEILVDQERMVVMGKGALKVI